MSRKYTLTKTECANIAKVMIASSCSVFDMFAFADCEDLITEDDRDRIISEIQSQCINTINKIEEKIGREINYSTTEAIINTMYFE